MTKTLTVNEIYSSIQGESTWAGLPCIFIRLTFCDLRCNYCDTEYAFHEGKKMTFKEISQQVKKYSIPLVEVTGGEPLLQPQTPQLLTSLCDTGYNVLLETSGTHDISKLDPRVHRIMDLKCPSSGESQKNLFSNLRYLNQNDEIKFVIGSREDYEWAREIVQSKELATHVKAILFSAVFPIASQLGHIQGHRGIEAKTLVEWILADHLPVRFQLQMHKFIWPPQQRSV
ncbi:MAG: 7-carboxy-7-deazaguanine synthase QueE [Verrucomicrobiae bacterium]|nr:7-carboxy-7-deazaguanine synthase QueE [Verrucomicrobiae bacterium]